MVAAPEPDAVREAGFFVERLQAEGMPLAGVVVNRATVSSESSLDSETTRAAAERAEQLSGASGPAGASQDAAGDGAGGTMHDGTAEVLWVHSRRVRRLEAEREVAARLTRLSPPVPTVLAPARPWTSPTWTPCGRWARTWPPVRWSALGPAPADPRHADPRRRPQLASSRPAATGAAWRSGARSADGGPS